jgi:hypothetical protein
LLTVDPSLVTELGGERAAWAGVRFRPFSRLSPRLGALFQAVAQSLQSDLLECVQANVRSFLAAVATELVDPDATRPPPQSPASARPTPPAPPSASPRG